MFGLGWWEERFGDLMLTTVTFDLKVTYSYPKVIHRDPKVTYSYPRVTYSDPRVTCSDPRVTYSDHKVTYSYPRVTYSYQLWCKQALGTGLSFNAFYLLPSLA